ncbi:MAG: hypothetical protein QOF71_3297, partial [Candidatus Eremiobacteraeota bacterium]|nr:hypothetical protein [Candidatus Eremiobacteraeota bacterium]
MSDATDGRHHVSSFLMRESLV